MTKSSRKKAQKEITERARRKKEKETWEPDLPFNELVRFRELCVEVIREAERVSKPQSLANTNYGEVRSRCHVGGGAHIDAGNWPKANGKPLTLVLELFLDDLPYVPGVLADQKLLQLFLELEEGEHGPVYSDGAWHINTESDFADLTVQKQGAELDEFFLSWKKVDTTPGYPDDIDIVNRGPLDELEEYPSGIDITSDYFGSMPFGLRVGGWPAWLDGSDVGEFVLQVSGDFINVDFGFDGIIYIGLDKGDWVLAWEIG